jgi:hypothetical protein
MIEREEPYTSHTNREKARGGERERGWKKGMGGLRQTSHSDNIIENRLSNIVYRDPKTHHH